ncbi:hypothetical protein H4N48_31030 [Streptomyces sp. BSE7-9]|nr:hypothetical protein [Streptomyces sp. BSE7-9]
MDPATTPSGREAASHHLVHEPQSARSPPSGPAQRAPRLRRPHSPCVDWSVSVALAQVVPTLPVGPDLHYEPKFDGHRLVMWRTAESVRLQTRSGRDVTPARMDLALAEMQHPPGTVLDGEVMTSTDVLVVRPVRAGERRSRSSPRPWEGCPTAPLKRRGEPRDKPSPAGSRK